ncbi:MAG: hypothetical protein AABX37_00440 [Nanoarchaeota archaeon]
MNAITLQKITKDMTIGDVRDIHMNSHYTKKPESFVFQYEDEWLSGFWCPENAGFRKRLFSSPVL